MGKKNMLVFLSEQEQNILLKQPNRRYPTGKRNHLILDLMLSTGIRLTELINLKWDDLDTKKSELIINSKTKKRTITIEERLLPLLNEWRECQQKKSNFSTYIFTTLKGNPLKTRYIQQMLARYAKRGNIKKNVSPKVLRYTHALQLYMQENNLSLLKEKLGFSDQSILMIHSQVNGELNEESLNKINFTQKSSTTKADNTDTYNLEQTQYKLSMYAIKCICGEIIVKNMQHCPGCKKNVRDVINLLKNNFNRVNWGLKES